MSIGCPFYQVDDSIENKKLVTESETGRAPAHADTHLSRGSTQLVV